METITSYDAASGGNVVNQLLRQYNGFDQLVSEYQEHSGAVDTGASPKVEYLYMNGANNTARLTSIQTPSGELLFRPYSGTDNDRLSRVSDVSWNGYGAGYAYLGLGTIIEVDYPEPQVRWSLTVNGTAANPYGGLDRFGRVIDCPWYSDAEAGYVERVRYGYDAAGNRLWRQNAVAPPGNDELYGCDGLNRLVEMARGTLAQDATHVENVQLSQDWTLDPTGNWNRFLQSDVADPSGNLDQSRWQNAASEITRIARRYGADWATPAYDAAGNMTSMPQPLDPPQAFAGTYDAWNRLTGAGAASYGYDGLHRRLGAPHESGGVRQFYYTADWRLVETRRSAEPGQGEYVYLWGQRYIDDQVLLTQPASGTSVAPPENHYALQDANWNVTAVCGNAGDVLERVRYTPYGLPTFLDAQFEPHERSQPHWRILYAGYWWDAESGLYQVRNRYLQSLVGIWLTRDPLRYLAGDANLYRYVHNKVLNRTDPTGLAGYGIVDGHPVPAVPDSTIKCACEDAYNYWFITPKDLDKIAFCKCLVWVQQQQKTGPAWLSTIPNCPCSIGNPPTNPNPAIWFDPESPSHLQTFHPGATTEIRSKPNAAGQGQQCCYDASGKLITDGQAGGTPDYVAPVGPGGFFGHVKNDVTSFNDCKRAGLLKFYLAYRPPNNGNNCPANVVTPL